MENEKATARASGVVRAKFKVQSYETSLDRGEELRTIKLTAVYDGSPENKQFFKWTPNGTISIGVLNRSAWEQFALGEEKYVDFVSAGEVVGSEPSVDEFHIAFYTKDCPPGTMDAVRVRVDMVRQRDMNVKMSVALCDHPLYSEIARYVESNPVPRG
jgi:hypothetical protein